MRCSGTLEAAAASSRTGKTGPRFQRSNSETLSLEPAGKVSRNSPAGLRRRLAGRSALPALMVSMVQRLSLHSSGRTWKKRETGSTSQPMSPLRRPLRPLAPPKAQASKTEGLTSPVVTFSNSPEPVAAVTSSTNMVPSPSRESRIS